MVGAEEYVDQIGGVEDDEEVKRVRPGEDMASRQQ